MAFDQQRLLEAIRALDCARSLSDILDALASSAARDASRVGILLVRGDALHTGVAASPTTAGGLTLAPFDLAEGRERIAVPIAVSGQVVAVLYADQGSQDDPQLEHPTGWPATLEVMARHAARCFEALTAFAAPLRRLTDNFCAELVRTLANGDAGMLGQPEVRS